MLGYLILLFTIIPAVELAILIEVGTHIGVGNTLLIIVFTGVVGAYLARLQGFIVLTKIQNELNHGNMPNSQLLDAFMILAGGLVLLTPGFITDIFGLILLIPWTRALIKLWTKKKLESMITKGEAIRFTNQVPKDDRYDDIDIN